MVSPFCVKRWFEAVVGLLVICVTLSRPLVACGIKIVTVKVKSLTDELFSPKPQSIRIDEWPSEPSKAHRKIAKIIMHAETDDEMVGVVLIDKAW